MFYFPLRWRYSLKYSTLCIFSDGKEQRFTDHKAAEAVFMFTVNSSMSSRNCFTFFKLMQQLIFPIFDYADIQYQVASNTSLLPLNAVYNRLCRFILGCPLTTHHCFVYEELNVPFTKKDSSITYNSSSNDSLQLSLLPKTGHGTLFPLVSIWDTLDNIEKINSQKTFMFKAPSGWNNFPFDIWLLSSFCLIKNVSFIFRAHCTCLFHLINCMLSS